MATTCTFKAYGVPANGHGCGSSGGNGVSEVSGTISLADENFLNISNPLAPVANSVTAGLVRTKLVSASAAATAGIEPGHYERVGGTAAAPVFRKTS